MAIVREPAALACFLFVAVAMALGGGPGELNLAFVAIAITGLAVIVTATRGAGGVAFQALPRSIRLAIALMVALPFVQLIPLPPAIWQALPGHGLRAAVLEAFGLGGAWLPLSITPTETAYSAVVGLTMLGLFMAVLAMPQDQLRVLVTFVVAMIAIGIVIGIIQFSSGGDSLQFYKVAHRDALIGFFANKNHMGLTLACLVPLSFILVEHQLDGRRGVLMLLGFGWVALVAMLVATNSRAGLLLGLIAMLTISLRMFPQHRKQVLLSSVLAALVTTALASFVPAIQDIIDRFGRTRGDLRLDFLEQGIPLIGQYGVMGSGLGSFVSVYAPTEKLEWVNPYYVNHLHNDWLQLIIEAGIPGVAVMLLMLAALAKAAHVLWFTEVRARNHVVALKGDERSYAWAGFVIVLLFALHSAGDYPVRRVGTLVLLVIALSLVFRPCIDRALLTRAAGRLSAQ